jgi:hypothetical protein
MRPAIDAGFLAGTIPSTASASARSSSLGSTQGMIAWTKPLVTDEIRLVTLRALRNFT